MEVGLYTQVVGRAARSSLKLVSEGRRVSLLHPDEPLRVILALREDFLSRLAESPELRDPGGPALRLGFQFEEGLVEEMTAFLERETASLPLLQLAASRLWEKRDSERRSIPRRWPGWAISPGCSPPTPTTVNTPSGMTQWKCTLRFSPPHARHRHDRSAQVFSSPQID